MRPVPLLIQRHVAQPEVGGEVDDPDAETTHLGHYRRRGRVRVSDDRGVNVLDPVDVELAQL